MHYEVPWLEDEAEWHAFEERLLGLHPDDDARGAVAATIVDLGDDLSMDNLRRRLKEFPGQPMMTLFNSLRFSRIRKSRWLCYLNAPDHFETEHPAFWEVKWLAGTLPPIFQAYSQLKWGERGLSLDELIGMAVMCWTSRREGRPPGLRHHGRHATPAAALARLRPTAEVYPDYYLLLERMYSDIRDHQRPR